MKKIPPLLAVFLTLAACDTFGYAPRPFPVWSPVPSRTPGIVSPTPIIFTLTPLSTTPAPAASISTGTPTATSTLTATPSTEAAPLPPLQSIQIDILGCNTSFDALHGMGEVTNAYVNLRNTGEVDLPNTCALLRAMDEDREHPDKKVCLPSLPVNNQATLKLTVDSAYKQDTAIQVDATSNDLILLRVDKPSCTDIGIFGSAPPDIGVIKPIP
jgi:hypothetical protein